MNYIVYKTTNLINGKIYVGVHRTNPDIFDGYIGCGVSRYDRKKNSLKGFPRAVAKYGYENFKRETLKVFPDSEQGMKDAYALEEKIVDKDFIKRKDTYNLTIGGKFCAYHVLRKEIAQYTIDGTFIRTWESITEAEQTLGISNISQALIGVSRYAGDFQWKYYKGDNSDIEATTTKEKTVYQFDMQGNLLKTWKSASEASRQFENDYSARVAINNCCRKVTHQAYGYYWSFKCKFEYKPKGTAVAKYNDQGEFLESYSSIKEAADKNGIKTPANINAAISGRQKRCGGFRWRYFYGNTENIKPL